MTDRNEHSDPMAAGFEEVLEDELNLLEELRDPPPDPAPDPEQEAGSVYARAQASNLSGLAFSGGGIRSATFNLGVIQALARYGLLSRFDYLSTVSGGGYIGGWLSALLHRKGGDKDRVDERAVEQFQTRLAPHPEDSGKSKPDATVGFEPVEHMAVRYLRRYSNYLTPRLGLSGDMLAAISIFVRNFTLIQLGLISLVAWLLLLAHLVAAGSAEVAWAQDWLIGHLLPVADSAATGEPARISIAASFRPLSLVLLGAVTLIFAGIAARRLTGRPLYARERRSAVERRLIDDPSFQRDRRKPGDRRTTDDRRLIHEVRDDADERRSSARMPPPINRSVMLWILLPLMIGAWAVSVAIVQLSELAGDHDIPAWLLTAMPGVLALAYVFAWMWGYLADGNGLRSKNGRRIKLMSITLFSAVVLGALLYAASCSAIRAASTGSFDTWHAVAFGPPLALLALLFSVTLLIGAARRMIDEHYREWMARMGGFLLLYAAAWAILFALILYAAPLVEWLAGGGLAALAAWAGGSGIGAWFARSPRTGDETRGASPWKELVSRIAPWLFVSGLAVIVAYATHVVLMEVFLPEGYIPSPSPDFAIASASALLRLNDLGTLQVFEAMAVTGLSFWLIVRRFDINLFSLHALYCNRLARAYLGASRAGQRRPDPFTGFDDADDMPFADLQRQRPIPVINTAVNMTGGDDLAWQTRRAASFAVTPRWAGFETRSTQGHRLGAYRPTGRYADGRKLGTWIAVSGAAASPNMGYHTSPALAALMTAFNLRLGRWCGNPVHADVWDKVSPPNAFQPILAELTGSATARADWINLTDGGHFDNLGVYELIRRRCRLIVVTDAGCDPEHHFEDLANLLRKCWTDLGVNIRFETLEPLKPSGETHACRTHFLIGRIEYRSSHKTQDGDERDVGIIIYLKASLTGDEWPDIRQYADTHKDFPHESTADQFFDENQFEAYRHLGYKVMAKLHEHIAARVQGNREPKDLGIGELVDLLMPKKGNGNTATGQPR